MRNKTVFSWRDRTKKPNHNPIKASGEFLTMTRVAMYPGKHDKFFIPLLNVSFKVRGEFFN